MYPSLPSIDHNHSSMRIIYPFFHPCIILKVKYLIFIIEKTFFLNNFRILAYFILSLTVSFIYCLFLMLYACHNYTVDDILQAIGLNI
jgi:hypothetical protein